MWPLTLAGGPPLLLFCLFRVNNLTAVARQQWNLKLSSAAEPRFISTSSSSKSQSGASPKIAPFCHIKLSLACLKWLMLYRLFPNNGEGVVGGKNDYLRRLHFRPPTGGGKKHVNSRCECWQFHTEKWNNTPGLKVGRPWGCCNSTWEPPDKKKTLTYAHLMWWNNLIIVTRCQNRSAEQFALFFTKLTSVQ